MKAVILANGSPPTATLAQSVIASADVFLAADGAALFAKALGCVPDIISGDFDSESMEEAYALFPNAEIVPTPDQDFADTEKAIRLLIERGMTEITLIGATGGRMDFTFANIALLLRYGREVNLHCLHDDGTGQFTEIRAVRHGTYSLEARKGEVLSLLTFEEGVRVSVSGVQWSLNNARLPIGTHGISNVVTENEVQVVAHSGTVLVFRTWSEF